MAIIDKTEEPKRPLKKTDAVKVVRVTRDGRIVNLKTVNAGSKTLGRDLGYVFASNVRAARKKG